MRCRISYLALLFLPLALLLNPTLARAEGTKFALLVGINKYQHGELNRLQFAEQDAAEVSEELTGAGYEVVVLLGKKATLAAILKELKAFRRKGDGDGVVVIGLAGHGIQPENGKDAYFCPWDAGKKVVKVNGKKTADWDLETMLPVSEVLAYLKVSPAGAKALLVDACRNDPRSGRGRGFGRGLNVGDFPKNLAVLLSCSEGERSWEDKKWKHGAFFYHVLQGLRGKALRKGKVTALRLADYVKEAVAEEVPEVIGGGARQRPQILISGDVDLRLLRRVTYDPTGGYRFVHFGPDGPRVVLRFNDRKKEEYFARVYDVATGKALSPPLKHDDWVNSAAYSPDGRRVVTASHDTTARVWDAVTGQALSPPLRHDHAVFHAAFSPDGRRVVTASVDKTARVWDAATGQALSPPLKHGDSVENAAFSPDGRRVVTASFDRTARVWDSATGQALSPPLKHDYAVRHAAFSPDGRRVVTASWDDTARVWDAATGQALSPPLKHAGSVAHAAFSPDGRRVVTASWDKKARVWDAATGKALSPPLKHDHRVRRAAFSPDGRRVVTASWDNTARVWDAATGKELKKATISAD
jgi:WD40 repeat protein